MAASSSGTNVDEKRKLINEWVTHLDEADSKRQWGQVVEAAQHYTRLIIGRQATKSIRLYIMHRIARQMKDYTSQESFTFSDHEKVG